MKKLIIFLTSAFLFVSCGPSIVQTPPVTKVISTNATTAVELGDIRNGHGTLYKVTVDSIEYILFYDGDNSCIIKHKDLRINNGNN